MDHLQHQSSVLQFLATNVTITCAVDVANDPSPHDALAVDPLVTMLLLAVLLSLIILVVTLTVVFVAVKLFAHFRAVSQAEEDGRYNNILKTLS